MDYIATLGKRNAQACGQSNRFHALFGLSLAKFWHPLTGFDIVAFDDVIRPARNQSLRDCIKMKYGNDAAQLIENLIRA